jgi:hypothetical protein
MKTTEMSSTLKAFAGLARTDRAEELRKLASSFSSGKNETVAARVKRIAKRLRSRPGCRSYPAGLKESLTSIASGFSASKAKQARDFEEVISLFNGAEAGGSVDEFVTWINEALVALDTGTARRTTPVQSPPDHRVVTGLAADLANTVLDSDAFSKVVNRLRDTNNVSAPTLSAVANRFLGNNKRYSGRKSAIDDIVKRHRQNVRAHARGKALDRLGV